MAIKLSGPLSFDSDIVREFISDNAIPADFRPHSLSEYYKLGEYVPDASPQNDNIPLDSSVNPFGLEEIKFSDFYGAVNQINVEFFEDKSNTNQNFYLDKDGDSVPVSKFAANVNLYDIADTFVANVAGEQNVPFVFTIDSDACFNNSIQTGGYFADLTIINKGIIAGRGGNGGSNGGNGSAGNAAIKILNNFDKITIDNLNGAYIAGGGGGGDGGSVSHSTKTSQSGGGGGWNGGSGGSGRCTIASSSYTTTSGGSGSVITSKNNNSTAGGNGSIVLQGIGYAVNVGNPAEGGLAGGGGGPNVVGYVFPEGQPTVEQYKTASASSGGGGGNKITGTATGGDDGRVNLTVGGARAGSYGAFGGQNSSNGGTGSDIPPSRINPPVSNPGGGGGWGASGGSSGGAGGKAVQKTGTGTLTYTTGTGTYYGTKDT